MKRRAAPIPSSLFSTRLSTLPFISLNVFNLSRPRRCTGTLSLSTMRRTLGEPPLPTDDQTSPPASSDRWWPYSSSGDFGSSLSIVLVALVCSLACGLAIHAVARFFVRWWKAAHGQSESTKPATPATAVIAASPAMVYFSGMELAGATAECAICLSEFADGERVRVLPRCRHGFHVACVETWLASHDSCPTCRGLCLAENSPDKALSLPPATV